LNVFREEGGDMNPSVDERAPFRFSTAALPPRERAQAIRWLHERVPFPGKIEPLESLPGRVPHVDIAKRALPGLEFFTGGLSGVRQTARPEGQPHTGHDELFLWLNVAGDSLVRRGGEERTMRGGNAFVASRGRAGFTILSKNRVRFLGMRMPRAALVPLIAGVDTEPLRAIPSDKVALRMLTTYATGVASEAAPLCGEPARAFVTHIYDLVALAIGPTADCTSIAEGRGLRAARLHRIKSDVLANLRHCGLTITDVAGLHGITPRYVHKLFEERRRHLHRVPAQPALSVGLSHADRRASR
jgi:hypothetical protein